MTRNSIHAFLYSIWANVLNFSFVVFVTLFLWWLMLIVWAGIKLTSQGPGLFIQDRVGRKARTFKCYKFRTLPIGTPSAGTHEVSLKSATRFGTFLRKSRLDELPQVINLLRGEMSLIGPRPCLPNQTKLIDARKRHNVFDVKPGISGWAQIHGIDMSKPETLAKMDADYIANRSIWMDIKIILMTLGPMARKADNKGV